MPCVARLTQSVAGSIRPRQRRRTSKPLSSRSRVDVGCRSKVPVQLLLLHAARGLLRYATSGQPTDRPSLTAAARLPASGGTIPSVRVEGRGETPGGAVSACCGANFGPKVRRRGAQAARLPKPPRRCGPSTEQCRLPATVKPSVRPAACVIVCRDKSSRPASERSARTSVVVLSVATALAAVLTTKLSRLTHRLRSFSLQSSEVNPHVITLSSLKSTSAKCHHHNTVVMVTFISVIICAILRS